MLRRPCRFFHRAQALRRQPLGRNAKGRSARDECRGHSDAPVLGLLIASTKTNFDTTSNQVEQFATNLALLDRELIQLGPDAKPVRDLLREFSSRKIALVWPAERGIRPKLHDNETDDMLDDMQGRLRSSSPQSEAQRVTRAEALRILGELKRTNRLLAVQVNIRTPLPFLAVVIFWLCVLFLSYAAFAPVNKVVLGAMIISAASVSIALNVIIDMDRPFLGSLRSPRPQCDRRSTT